MPLFDYTHNDMYNETLQALHNLGGAAKVTEIEDEVSRLMNLTEEQVGDIHKGNRTRFSYRLA